MSDIIWRMFDPASEVDISTRQLPHWDQTGALTFVTFRLADSLPKNILEQWNGELREWLDRNGRRELDACEVERLPEHLRRLFLKFRKQRWHRHLDDCHGSCVLRDPTLAEIVGDSLLYFDGRRYDIERYVVMPNHVHVLVQMRTGWGLRKQCGSWMRFTGRVINEQLGRRGEFWQGEPFDHIVRSEEQFRYFKEYIEENPAKAKLRVGEYLFWKREG